MKLILWLSQHQPLPVQLARLAMRFGQDVKVVRDGQTFTNAEELVRRFNRGGYDDWVVVAPLSVLSRICELAAELGIPKPLYSEMQVLQSSKRGQEDLAYRGRLYKFLKFRRVKRLVLEFEDGQDF